MTSGTRVREKQGKNNTEPNKNVVRSTQNEETRNRTHSQKPVLFAQIQTHIHAHRGKRD